MAESERLDRRSIRDLAARGLGRDARQSRSLRGHMRLEAELPDTLNLPTGATVIDMQDPAHPTHLYFVDGLSTPGGPDVPRP